MLQLDYVGLMKCACFLAFGFEVFSVGLEEVSGAAATDVPRGVTVNHQGLQNQILSLGIPREQIDA